MTVPDDWMDAAWCKHAPNPDAWIYPDGERGIDRSEQRAALLCSPCVVKRECARYLLARTLPYDCVQAGKPWGRTEIERMGTARQLAGEYELSAPERVTDTRGGRVGTKYVHNTGRCESCHRWLRHSSTRMLGANEARYGGRGMCDRCYKKVLRREHRERNPLPPRQPGQTAGFKRYIEAYMEERVSVARQVLAEAPDYMAARNELMRRFGVKAKAARRYIAAAREREVAS